MPCRDRMILLLCGAVAEEVLFRGYLLRRWLPRGTLSAALATAGLFALLHGVNLFQGDGLQSFLQILCAFIVGLYYALVTLRCGSLLPSIIGHGLTNLTGAAGVAGDSGWMAAALCVCMGIYALLSWRLWRSGVFVNQTDGKESDT